ncbi:hypothetical protein GF340_02880, partial [Candidatus Peregrinibacteria bacterium]|nr:hypothetical protein [Candidatus Peregrinibacteria bacterium]
NHSIPDSMGVVVKTPAGNIVHTGDFKFDMTPSGLQKPAEFDKISQLQHQDIAALFIDSTNALKPGHTITEQRIGQSLENIVKSCPGRIIIASFASQIGRLQQIIDIAMKCDRKVVLSGRSLVENFIISKRIGYLHVPQDTVFEAKKAHRFPDEKTIILTTGSQGENVAALSRMALQEHPKIKIKKGDTVIMSSSPIPGNERAIFNVMNNLTRLGARVIDNKIMDVHSSGHGQEEDVKLMISFVKPKNVVPIHGEFFMRTGCGEIAKGMGYADDQVVMLENGHVIEIENGNAVSKKEIIPNRYVLVDGYGVDDVSANVIMDRQKLSQNGVIVLLFTVNQKTKKLLDEVNIISRGFIYMKESEKLVKEITETSQNAYKKILEKRPDAKRQEIKKYIQETVDRHIHDKLNRQPLILPVFFEK